MTDRERRRRGVADIGGKDGYITNCKLCKRGIFANQNFFWANAYDASNGELAGPVLGFVHADCLPGSEEAPMAG